MPDLHLLEPPDDRLLSPRQTLGVGVGVVALWAFALGAAAWVRNNEVISERLQRYATTEAPAPPPRYPGGIDRRALDPGGTAPALEAVHVAGPLPPGHPAPGPTP